MPTKNRDGSRENIASSWEPPKREMSLGKKIIQWQVRRALLRLISHECEAVVRKNRKLLGEGERERMRSVANRFRGRSSLPPLKRCMDEREESSICVLMKQNEKPKNLIFLKFSCDVCRVLCDHECMKLVKLCIFPTRPVCVFFARPAEAASHTYAEGVFRASLACQTGLILGPPAGPEQMDSLLPQSGLRRRSG